MISLIIQVVDGRPTVLSMPGSGAQAERNFIKFCTELDPVRMEHIAPSGLLAAAEFHTDGKSLYLLTVDTNDNPISRMILSLIDAVDEKGLNANSCPVQAPEWNELGEIYMHACALMDTPVKRV